MSCHQLLLQRWLRFRVRSMISMISKFSVMMINSKCIKHAIGFWFYNMFVACWDCLRCLKWMYFQKQYFDLSCSSLLQIIWQHSWRFKISYQKLRGQIILPVPCFNWITMFLLIFMKVVSQQLVCSWSLYSWPPIQQLRVPSSTQLPVREQVVLKIGELLLGGSPHLVSG